MSTVARKMSRAVVSSSCCNWKDATASFRKQSGKCHGAAAELIIKLLSQVSEVSELLSTKYKEEKANYRYYASDREDNFTQLSFMVMVMAEWLPGWKREGTALYLQNLE